MTHEEEEGAWVGVREAAALLGVSERTIWRYVADGKLNARPGLVEVRSTQPGQLFSREELEEVKRLREAGKLPEK